VNSNPDSEATRRAPLGDTGNAPSPQESAADPIAGLSGLEVEDEKDLGEFHPDGEDASGGLPAPRPVVDTSLNENENESEISSEQLYDMVFEFDSAVQMAMWRRTLGDTVDTDEMSVMLSELPNLSPEERHRLKQNIARYRRFAESEYYKGAYWIRFLEEAMDLWNSVPRSDSINRLGDSVFGKLIAKIGVEEDRRFPGLGGDPSLAMRFREARNAAWKVVAEEALKPLLCSEKPGKSLPSARQLHFDAAFLQGSSSFFKLSPTSLNGLDWSETILRGRIKNRNPQGSVEIQTYEDAVKKRLWELRNRRIAPTKELVAALLWTSAHLPLCLMKSSAAADAVREILLSLGGGEHSEALNSQEAFRQNFKTMTTTKRQRGLKYFDEILMIKSKRAEIITAVGVEAGTVAEAAPEAGSGDASRDCVGEPSLDKNSQLAALEELLARVKTARDAMASARDSLLELTSERLWTNGNADLTELLRGLSADLKPQIRWFNGRRIRRLKEWSRLVRLEEQLEEEVSQLHLQLAPRAPEKILTLTIAARYQGTGVDKLRFRILDLERGLIAPE
jgi:hypothetical protein